MFLNGTLLSNNAYLPDSNNKQQIQASQPTGECAALAGYDRRDLRWGCHHRYAGQLVSAMNSQTHIERE